MDEQTDLTKDEIAELRKDKIQAATEQSCQVDPNSGTIMWWDYTVIAPYGWSRYILSQSYTTQDIGHRTTIKEDLRITRL